MIYIGDIFQNSDYINTVISVDQSIVSIMFKELDTLELYCYTGSWPISDAYKLLVSNDEIK